MIRPTHSNVSMHGHPLKMCAKCKELRVPEGGIEMTQSKWICGACWALKITTRKTAK